MRIVVQKYGGSSVADLDRLRGVAQRIAASRQAGLAPVVVVSAMGNTTNELIALARQVSPRPDRRELDMLISVGERIAMSLLAMALRELGVPAVSLTGSQSGIVTDEAHADARVVEVRPERILLALERGQVPIVAGFQGMSRDREVTTLGRGGSDTTAVVLAAALGAEHCEICSDVDGVWTADPRQVLDASKIDAIGLETALELARGGAKVLFEEAVRYARDRGIALHASSTFGSGTGTRLATAPVPSAFAVTLDDQLFSVRLAPADVEGAREIARRGGKIRRAVGDQLHVDTRNAHGGLNDLGHGAVLDGPMTVVTVVNSGLGERVADVRALHAVVCGVGSPRAWGCSGDQAWWQVDPPQGPAVVAALHAWWRTPNEL